MLRALTLAVAALTVSAQPNIPVTFLSDGNFVELRNGYVRMIFNAQRGSLDVLQGRFEGDGAFDMSLESSNVCPTPARNTGFQRPTGYSQGCLAAVVTGNGASLAETSTSSVPLSTPAPINVVANTTSYAGFSVTLTDGPSAARLRTTFTFSLASGSRSLTVNSSVTTLSSFNATAVQLQLSFSPRGSYSAYAKGMRQGMDFTSPYLASTVPLSRYWALGNTGAVDVLQTGGGSIAYSTVMYSGIGLDGRRSGISFVLSGQVTDRGWMDGYENYQPSMMPANTWSLSLQLFPNQYDFPASSVPVTAAVSGMPVNDLRAIMTGVYASPMGALHSYDYYPETRIAPCIDINGNVCYGGLYNFFDPDSFLSVSAMILTMDPLVLGEVKNLINTNSRFLCDGKNPAVKCEFGQAMHHFVEGCGADDPYCVCTTNPQNPALQDCVTYEAISGAVQTGPNIFLTWAGLRYAAYTGDYAWLQGAIGWIRTLAAFLLARYDANVGLFNVPGSLQIDTFIRANYTSDTNSAMVLLLERLADAETYLGNATGAALYSGIAATVRTSMVKYLWAASNDHFCTNSNPDANAPGGVLVCARDFVDYDSNTLAVAAGVVTGAQAQAVLARVDSGPCTHSGATWVSEVYYDAENCQSQNTGDSAISMGRISWSDALARRASGDAANEAIMLNTVLAPLQYDLLSSTWLYERYTCQRTPTHNAYYIEMGEVVGMILAEAKYGITWGMNGVTISPVTSFDAWSYAMGPVAFTYGNHTSFSAAIPHVGTKTFTVERMQPGSYTVTPGGNVAVGADGILTFSATMGPGRSVTAVKTG